MCVGDAEVGSFLGRSRVEGVRLLDGRLLVCDLVVVAVGAVPRVNLAADAGIAVDDGVLVDEALRTSAPDVFAAGDIASVAHPFYGHRVRCEHWLSGCQQADVAARSMLDQPGCWDQLPSFSSELFATRVQGQGLPVDVNAVIERVDPATCASDFFWLNENQVVAAASFGASTPPEEFTTLIRSKQPVDARRLADGQTPLLAVWAGG